MRVARFSVYKIEMPFLGVKPLELVVSKTLHLLYDVVGQVVCVLLCILLLNRYDLLRVEESGWTSATVLILMEGLRGIAVALAVASLMIFLRKNEHLIDTIVPLSFVFFAGERPLHQYCEFSPPNMKLFLFIAWKCSSSPLITANEKISPPQR